LLLFLLLGAFTQNYDSLILHLIVLLVKYTLFSERLLEEGMTVGRVISSTDHHIELLLFIVTKQVKILYHIFVLIFIVSETIL
jgi:hypothetical protein